MNRIILPLALVLLLLAAGLRFYALDGQSFWNDEGNSYGQALRSPTDIWVNAAADIHPPGYYWLLAGWRVLTGESEFALRALSVFASILSAACAFALARRLYGCTAGLVAMAVVAVNTFSITYAQEARMYALLALTGAASTWALVLVLHGAGRGRVIALALTTTAGLYTNYAYAGVLALHVVMGLAWLVWVAPSNVRYNVRGTFLRLTAGYSAALVLFLPWLPTALNQVTSWGSTGDPIPASEAIPVALGYLIKGNTYTVTGISVAAVLLLALGLLPTIGTRRADRRTLWALALPPLWVILTLGGFLALELFRPANLKFLLPAQIGMALWLGRGAWALWKLNIPRQSRAAQLAPKFAALASAALLVLGGWGGLDALYNAPEFRRDDYRGIVREILADGGAGSAVILNGPGQREVFEYNAARQNVDFTVYPLPVGMTPDRAATEQAIADILAAHPRVYGVFWGTDERDPQRIVETALAARAYPLDDRWFGSVRLVRYVSPDDSASTTPLDGAEFTFDGGDITLHGYRLGGTALAPGGVLTLDLDWSTDAPIPVPLVVTVQLLDADGRLVTQRDSQPANATAPAQTWTPGQRITDRHALVIPNDLAPAQYRLIVALYTPGDTFSRLPVGGSDALTLTELSVSAE